MGNSCAGKRYPHHVVLGGFPAFFDGIRHLARLAETQAHAALAIPNDNQRAEAEPSSALDHLGRTVDVDHLLDQFVLNGAVSIQDFGLVTGGAGAAATTARAAPATATAIISATCSGFNYSSATI